MKIYQPVPIPCSKYLHPNFRCANQATHWLLDPDGGKVPGGYLCQQHAQECVDEYALKLNEQWTMVELTPNKWEDDTIDKETKKQLIQNEVERLRELSN